VNDNDMALNTCTFVFIGSLRNNHFTYNWEHSIILMLHLADWLIVIDWCLTPTLAVFQLYCGMNRLHT